MLFKKILHRWLGSLLILLPSLLLAQTPPGPVELTTYSPTLTWCPSAGATGYKVYVGTKSQVYDAPVIIGDITQHEVRALGPGTYYFAVKAFDTGGLDSVYSNEVAITIMPPSLPAPAISQLTVSSIDKYSATIIWTTTDECSGTAMWSTDKTRWFAIKANNLGTTDHLAVISGLVARTHYYFKVQSVCNEKTIESEVRSFNTK